MNNYTENEEKEFSMKWWDFNQYIRFPFGILTSISVFIRYLKLTSNSVISLLLVLNILNGILLFVTSYYFFKRTKVGYKLLNILLIYELLSNSFSFALKSGKFDIINFCVFISVYGIIWTLPNYIYFKKRKSLFNNTLSGKNKVKKNYIDEVQNNKDDENLRIFIDKLENYQNTNPDFKANINNNFIRKTEKIHHEVYDKTCFKNSEKENTKTNITTKKEKSRDNQESIEEIITFGIVTSVLITLLFCLLILFGYLVYKSNIINNSITNFIFFTCGVFLVLFILTILCIINKTKKDAINCTNTNRK